MNDTKTSPTKHQDPTQQSSNFTTILIVLVGSYLAAQLLADVASLKLISPMGRVVDAGTLIYPITFTLRDLIHKLAGKTVARTLIATAAAINLFMAGFFLLVAQFDPLAGDPVSSNWGTVLGPVWRIVFASIIAEVLSELLDTEVYSKWVAKFGSKYQWGRVLASNVAAIPLDTLVFASIAWIGVEPSGVIKDIIILNIVVKVAATIVTVPLIYAVRADRFAKAQQ